MNYYCYVYYDENWQGYYVGKGQGNRCYRSHNHPDVPNTENIQIFYFKEEWQALECEIELISFWKRQCDGGTLLNKCTGGLGSPGVKRTPETRRKIAASRRGKKHSDETKMKMSKSHQANPHRHDAETRKRISDAKKKWWANLRQQKEASLLQSPTIALNIGPEDVDGS